MTSIFIALSVLTLVSSVLAILSKIPIYSLLFIVITFFSISGHFLILQAHFLAAVQVIVYAGAIIVLFLFTIMFINLNVPTLNIKSPWVIAFSILSCLALLGFILYAVHLTSWGAPAVNNETDDVKVLGKLLLNQYFFPFEFISVLLLTTMIGAVLITKKNKISE